MFRLCKLLIALWQETMEYNINNFQYKQLSILGPQRTHVQMDLASVLVFPKSRWNAKTVGIYLQMTRCQKKYVFVPQRFSF